MRILRGLSSRHLACGCLAGVYETYDGKVVTILDIRGAGCANPNHVSGNVVPIDPIPGPEHPGRPDTRTD
jgi:hypothetical protein